MASPPSNSQSLKRAHPATMDTYPKRPRLDGTNPEIKMVTVPQFIEEMNAILALSIGKGVKMEQLMSKIDAFYTLRGSVFGYNPSYGRQIAEVAQRCLQLDSSKEAFKFLKLSAEAACLPHELSYKILETFSTGQPWKTMVERLEDDVATLKLANKYALKKDKKTPEQILKQVGILKGYPSLFHRLALVSKTWHVTLLSLFSAKMSYVKLGQLGINNAEGVIRLAQFCRGFFSSLSLGSSYFSEKIDFNEEQMSRLLPHIPKIKKIKLPNSIKLKSFIGLIHSTHMNRLESLSLSSCLDLESSAWQSLGKTTALKSLCSLDLSNVSLDAMGCMAVFQAPFLSTLMYLDLSDNPIKKGLIGDPNFSRMVKMDLSKCQLKSLGALVNWKMPKLRLLDVSLNPLNHQAILALSNSQMGETIEEIAISIVGTKKNLLGNRGSLLIDEGTVISLLRGLPKLRELEICAVKFGALGLDGAAAIANHWAAQQLEFLNLESSVISDGGLIHLLNSSYLSNLKSLNVSYNIIGPHGLRAFEKSKQRFSSLFLDEAQFGDNGEAMKIFTTAPSTAQLKSLSLQACDLCEESQEILVNTSGFLQLTRLIIAETDFLEKFLIQLSLNHNFSNLEILDITGNEIASDIILKVAESNVLKNLREIIFDIEQEEDPGLEQVIRAALSQNRGAVPAILEVEEEIDTAMDDVTLSGL